MSKKHDFKKISMALVFANIFTLFVLYCLIAGLHSEGVRSYDDNSSAIFLYLVIKSVVLIVAGGFFFYRNYKKIKQIRTWILPAYGIILFVTILIIRNSMPVLISNADLMYGDIKGIIILLNVDCAFGFISSVIYSLYARKRHYENVRSGMKINIILLMLYIVSVFAGWTR